jgi:predicted ATPase
MPVKTNFHVISGGPGSGKTSLIGELARRGFATIHESGRAIIRAQRVIGGNAFHTGDKALYAELMLAAGIADYERMADIAGPVFFDRSIAELVGYGPLVGIPTPAHFHRAAEVYRYAPRVFLAPPWAEIYASDAERKQDFAEAIASYAAAVLAYRSAGYEVTELPRAPVAERADYVLARVGAS